MRAVRSSQPPLSRGEATRARIREAANALFLRDGVEATTVEAIAAAAGVSKPTFYLYFQRKEDLLLEYGLQRLRRARDLLPDLIACPTFREALNGLLDAVVRGKVWGRELTGRAIVEIGTSAERSTGRGAAHDAEATDRARPGARRDSHRHPRRDPGTFRPALDHGALSDWGLGTDPLDRDRALELAVTLVLDALARRDDR